MAGFTEAAFMFAAIHELYVDGLAAPGVAPHFPSQWRESKDEPYDVSVPTHGGSDSFFQFKRSTLRVELRPWDAHNFQPEFFQCDVHKIRRGQQHNDLRDFAATNHDTYYVAPRFTELRELHEYFLAGEICQRSMTLPIRGLPEIVDRASHRLFFDRTQTRGVYCSDPVVLGENTAATLSSRVKVLADRASTSRISIRDRLPKLQAELLVLAEKRSKKGGRSTEGISPKEIAVELSETAAPPAAIARALRNLLDLEWVIFAPKNDAAPEA
jgi:hypothetical protein